MRTLSKYTSLRSAASSRRAVGADWCIPSEVAVISSGPGHDRGVAQHRLPAQLRLPRLRVTLAAVAVLSAMMILLGVAVDGVFAAQSNRSLDAVLSGRVQLCAAAGPCRCRPAGHRQPGADQRRAGPSRTGQRTVFGDELAPGLRSTTAVLKGPRRVDGAVLTVAVDASQAAAAQANVAPGTDLREAWWSSG